MTVAVMLCLSATAYCRTDAIALLLQQTPVNGGTVNLKTGVHYFEPGTEITLTAVAKPGYQFVCWLGDVGDTTSSNTYAYLDTPKIIIAVFERAKYDFIAVASETPTGGGGAGGLIGSARDYIRQGGGGAGGRRPRKWRWPTLPEPEPEEPEDFPVPDEDSNFPVPEEVSDFPVPQIPEPATGILFAFGSLLFFSRRNAKKRA